MRNFGEISVILIGKCLNYTTPHQEAIGTYKIISSVILTAINYTLISLFMAYYFEISYFLCFFLLCLLGMVFFLFST